MSNRCGQVGSHCVSYRTGLAPASKGQLGSFPGVPVRFPPRLWIWERIALVFPNILLAGLKQKLPPKAAEFHV